MDSIAREYGLDFTSCRMRLILAARAGGAICPAGITVADHVHRQHDATCPLRASSSAVLDMKLFLLFNPWTARIAGAGVFGVAHLGYRGRH